MSAFEVLGNVGGALSGASSFFGSLNQLLNLDDYYRQSQDAFNKQRQLMSENNQFQSIENQKSRDYQSVMYEKQFSDLVNYNSYASMVQRAKDAGISPAALFQNGAPSMLGGISPVSAGHSASPSPSYEGIVNPVNRQAESFHSISSGLKALGDLAKTGMETSQLVPLMSAQIKNQLSQSGLNDIRSMSEDFELGLRQIYGKKLYDSELGKNYSQMINAYNQAYLFAEEGKTQDSVRQLNLADRLYKDSLRLSTDKQVEFMGLQMSWYPKQMRAQIENLLSSASESSANADQTRLFNKIYSDKRFQHSIISQAVTAGQQAIDSNKMTKQQVQHLNYMIEQAAYANEMKEFSYWSSQIQSYMSSLGQAASAFYGAGALRELIKLRQIQSVPPTTVRGFGQ